MSESYVVGIDEVGRGPLAGPVVVCALAIFSKSQVAYCKSLNKKNKSLPPLRDSKKLSKIQRQKWYEWIKDQPSIDFSVSRVYPKGIERLNISQAANLAATRAFLKLATSHWGIATRVNVILDGGLYLKLSKVKCQMSNVSARTVIKGDERYAAIKLASIVAKVIRDKYMEKLHKKYPEYGFNVHKGYGTKKHILALKKCGPSKVHRAKFIEKFV